MMKNYFKLLLIIVLIKTSVSAQNDLKQYKAGHVFNIGLPTYMTKTIGLNSSSSIEYENKIKDDEIYLLKPNKYRSIGLGGTPISKLFNEHGHELK